MEYATTQHEVLTRAYQKWIRRSSGIRRRVTGWSVSEVSFLKSPAPNTQRHVPWRPQLYRFESLKARMYYNCTFWNVFLLEGNSLHTGYKWGKPDSKRQFERPNVNGRIILKWILKNGMAECGLDSSDWWWLHKVCWISWLAEDLMGSQERVRDDRL